MTVQMDAIFEEGVFRPLAPLSMIGARERVHLLVTRSDSGSPDPLSAFLDHECIAEARRELALLESRGHQVPSWEELRSMLANDHSSWSDDIIAERKAD